MSRTLRASLRPTIALGVIFGGISIWVASGYFLSSDHPVDQLQAAAFLMGIYVLLMAQIYAVRISVDEVGVTVRRWFLVAQRIPFEEIVRSDVQFLAERDWPVKITIRRASALSAVTLGMKAVQRNDASWFCSLPQLKIAVHPGLTARPNKALERSRDG